MEMEVRINDECSACGVCEDICPEVFELGDEKAQVKVNPVPEEYEDKVREAADECPSEAIEIIE
ncbi:MAG: ferredoxin [Dethiobacteria bacterium]|jgi:ferredoxin